MHPAKLKILIIGLLLFSNALVFGQHNRPNGDKMQLVGTVGLGVGQENLVSMPKLSGFASFKLGNRSISNHGNFQKNAFYLGSEASVLIFFAGAVSVSGTAGIKVGSLSFDGSLTRLWLANPDGNVVARQTTLNPKMGVMIGPVWLKAGPSFLLTDNSVWRELFGNFMHIDHIACNLELNYILSWRKTPAKRSYP